VPQPGGGTPTGSEDDESGAAADNSLGRLLTLCDGVFAIAITLLTFDLKLPDVGNHPSDATLRHALAHQSSGYYSFALSFFLISRLWGRHRRVMRAVVISHPRMIRDTIWLLFVVASMPCRTDLFGSHASTPIALSLYCLFNAVAALLLIELNRTVRKYELLDERADISLDAKEKWDSWRNVAVFILGVPAGYVIGRNGPWVLVLLAVPVRFPRLARLTKRHRVPAA
jgi:uncharacterized membrane protein